MARWCGVSDTYYVVSRIPPTFPHRAPKTVLKTNRVGDALRYARLMGRRNRSGAYDVYAVENGTSVRGATYKAGELVAIGQQGNNPYAWDWSDRVTF